MLNIDYMEITTTTINQNPSRRAAINSLAVVGFIALIIIGIGLAIYSARYVPIAVSRIGTAAVSLSQVFRPAHTDPALQVVSLASTTLPIENDVPTTTATTTVTFPTATTTPVKTTTAGTPGTTTHTVVTTTTTRPAPYGLSDLSVIVTQVGYLDNGTTDSFIGATSIPYGKTGAVKFTVRNIGTNVSGNWNFRADVPTYPSFSFTSPDQQSLLPGDQIDYTLGFDRGQQGNNRVITITVDPSNYVSEQNENNNSASGPVTVL
ncbi:MAG: Peptidase sortase-like protein [Parcubacteria group bacterium]|nr:Peptidase sortase-like protein [Parcubacteria group bacterium]